MIFFYFLVKFNTNCGPDPPTLQTVRQSDRQLDVMRSQDRALH